VVTTRDYIHWRLLGSSLLEEEKASMEEARERSLGRAITTGVGEEEGKGGHAERRARGGLHQWPNYGKEGLGMVMSSYNTKGRGSRTTVGGRG